MPFIEHHITADGSSTLINKNLNTSYHSLHGALQESQHVFIKNGLQEYFKNQESIKIFELGFGTGVNSLLSLEWAIKNNIQIHYTSIEKHIVPNNLIHQLNYSNLIKLENSRFYFDKIHNISWNESHLIHPLFTLTKLEADWLELNINESFDIIYFDAFGPGTQPELWNLNSMSKANSILKPNGILVTFCAQGEFRRTLKSIGFQIEKLAGPPGKREMTKAIKIITNM